MEELLRSVLLGSDGLVAYATVFGILLACGLGLPLPEDVSLILGGYLAHHGAASLEIMMAVGFSGILAGDSAIFWAGRRVGSRVGQAGGFFSRIVTPQKRAQVQALFARHGPKVVMIARFLPGVRAVTYFTAGSAGMKYWRFAFFDGVAALVSAPLFVYLGYRFGDELDLLIHKLKRGQVSVIVAVAAVVLAWVAFRQWRKRAAQKKSTALLGTSGPEVEAANNSAAPSAPKDDPVGLGSPRPGARV